MLEQKIIKALTKKGELNNTQLYRIFCRSRANNIQLALKSLVTQELIEYRKMISLNAKKPTTYYRIKNKSL